MKNEIIACFVIIYYNTIFKYLSGQILNLC